MAEWLRRQIRISLNICFALRAQVQILLVSSVSCMFISCIWSSACAVQRRYEHFIITLPSIDPTRLRSIFLLLDRLVWYFGTSPTFISNMIILLPNFFPVDHLFLEARLAHIGCTSAEPNHPILQRPSSYDENGATSAGSGGVDQGC